MAVFQNEDPEHGQLGTVPMAEWANSLGLSPDLVTPVRTVTASDDIDPDLDHIILVDASAGAINLQLAALADIGVWREFVFIRIDNHPENAVIVLCNGAETINGATSLALELQWETVRIKKISSTQFVRLH